MRFEILSFDNLRFEILFTFVYATGGRELLMLEVVVDLNVDNLINFVINVVLKDKYFDK